MVIPRNALQGLPLHKVDVRLTKDFALSGSTRVSLIAEVYNLFNHANYGSYNTSLDVRVVRAAAAERRERLRAAAGIVCVPGGF